MTDSTLDRLRESGQRRQTRAAATALSPVIIMVLATAALVVVALLIYLWGTPPALWGDDWGVMKRLMTGTLRCQSSDLRPLGFCWVTGVFTLFQTNVMAIQVATVLLSAALALLVFLAVELLLPRRHLFAFAVALLFLLYPTDYTHNWIIGGNVKVPLILFMLSLVLMLLYWRGGSLWSWLASMVVLGVSLFVYEQHLGLVALMAGLLFLYAPALSRGRRLLLLGPLAVVGLYGLQRWRVQLQVGSAFGHNMADVLSLTPLDIARRIGQTLYVGLWQGWQEGVTRALAGEATVWLLPVVALALVVGGGWLLYRRGGPEALGGLPELRTLFALLALGLLVMVAAAFPGLLVNEPQLHFERTRFNILPSIGAALILVSLAALLVRLAGGRARRAGAAALLGLLLVPLLLLAGGVQRQVNAEYNAAWDYHKRMMNALLEQAPDLESGSYVILTLPLPEPLPLGPKPIASGVWGFSSELTMMYRRNVQGSFRWGTPEDLKFVPEGVRLPGRGTPIPYENVLLFHYDGEILHPVTQLPPKALAEVGPRELCPGCIKPGPGRANSLRFLLE